MEFPSELIKNFWSKVEKTDNCWFWKAGVRDDGYGQFWVSSLKKSIGPHRFSFMLAKGEIDANLIICHSCDNPLCVNPSHLFSGTQKQNICDMVSKHRGFNQNKTHCTKGHPLVEPNLYYRKSKPGRICKICHLEHCKKTHQKRKYEK